MVKKSGQDNLRDIRRVENAVQPRAPQWDANGFRNRRFVAKNQFRGSIFVSRTYRSYPLLERPAVDKTGIFRKLRRTRSARVVAESVTLRNRRRISVHLGGLLKSRPGKS